MKWVVLICSLYIFTFVSGQSLGNSTGKLNDYDPKNPYCFHFTWLGPEYDNTTFHNDSCKTVLQEKNAKNVPCRDPMVMTFDGTEPDIDYLWANHKDKVLCRRSRGQICAKYSYYFNNEVQNVTYMCTKAIRKNANAATRGCFLQKGSGHKVEVCLCESKADGYKPCNEATIKSFSFIAFLLNIFLYYIIK